MCSTCRLCGWLIKDIFFSRNFFKTQFKKQKQRRGLNRPDYNLMDIIETSLYHNHLHEF